MSIENQPQLTLQEKQAHINESRSLRRVQRQTMLKDLQKWEQSFSQLVETAEENRSALESGRLTRSDEAALSQTPTDDVSRLDVLAQTTKKHQKLQTLRNVTIPVFTRIRDEWRSTYLTTLEENVAELREDAAAGHLPQSELKIAEDIYVAEKTRLSLSAGATEVEETIPEEERSEREYAVLRYHPRGKVEEVSLLDIEDEGDYQFLTYLADRSGVFVSVSQLRAIQNEIGESKKITPSTHIRRLWEMVGDNPESPRIIQKTGIRRGTSYRFNPLTEPELISVQTTVDELEQDPEDNIPHELDKSSHELTIGHVPQLPEEHNSMPLPPTDEVFVATQEEKASAIEQRDPDVREKLRKRWDSTVSKKTAISPANPLQISAELDNIHVHLVERIIDRLGLKSDEQRGYRVYDEISILLIYHGYLEGYYDKNITLRKREIKSLRDTAAEVYYEWLEQQEEKST